jgi:hypothetical protein
MIGIMTKVTEATMPNIMRGGDYGESTGRPVLERIKLPVLLYRIRSRREIRSFSEKLKWSKCMEQLLSVVN